MKLKIIGNPIAGGGKGRPRIQELAGLLRAAGHHVQVMLTTKAGDARQWAGELENDLDRLIVAGGDGTLNEVLNGLIDPARTPIVQMPVGTANVLVRELGLPWKPAGVAKLVETGVIRRVDLCEARGMETEMESKEGIGGTGRIATEDGAKPQAAGEWRRFLVVMSSGFDAMVIHDIHHHRKGKLGFFGYMKPILRTIRQYTAPVLKVRVDGGEPVEGAMIVVANAANYAGLMTVAEAARMDSGVLEVCVMQRGSVLSLMGFAIAAWRRKLAGRSGVRFLTGRHITIESDRPVPVEVDGEWIGQTPVEARVTPGVVPMVVGVGK